MTQHGSREWTARGVDTASGIIEGTACRSIAVGESLGALTTGICHLL